MYRASFVIGLFFLLLSIMYFLDYKKIYAFTAIPFESHPFIGVLSIIAGLYALLKWVDELMEFTLFGPFAIFGTIDIILFVLLTLQGLLNFGVKSISFIATYIPVQKAIFVYYVLFLIASIQFLLGPILRLQY